MNYNLFKQLLAITPHRGAQRNVSIEPLRCTDTVKPARALETEGTREQHH